MTQARLRSAVVRAVVLVLLCGTSILMGTSPAAAATVAAQDGFGRTVASGLGTADTGGAWTLSGTATDFSVSSGVAHLRVGRGLTRAAYLTSVAVTDVDASGTFSTTTAPTGGGVYNTLVVRRRNGSDYGARLVLGASGAVTLAIFRDATALRSVSVTGWTVSPGTRVRVRVQALGRNPTTLRARVWRVGTTEPTTWQALASDATAALQGSGGVGLRSYVSSSATTASVVSDVDDLVVMNVAGSRPTQAEWLGDVSSVLRGATSYVDSQRGVPRPAIVLDIDNTALQSYYQPFVATPAALEVAKRAEQGGYAILFATGRSADSGGTSSQLTRAGYRIDSLCFRDPAAASIQASKTACRAGWTSQGYTIVANIGNHTTDLDGGDSGKTYLLPNYGFLD